MCLGNIPLSCESVDGGNIGSQLLPDSAFTAPFLQIQSTPRGNQTPIYIYYIFFFFFIYIVLLFAQQIIAVKILFKE